MFLGLFHPKKSPGSVAGSFGAVSIRFGVKRLLRRSLFLIGKQPIGTFSGAGRVKKRRLIYRRLAVNN